MAKVGALVAMWPAAERRTGPATTCSSGPMTTMLRAATNPGGSQGASNSRNPTTPVAFINDGRPSRPFTRGTRSGTCSARRTRTRLHPNRPPGALRGNSTARSARRGRRQLRPPATDAFDTYHGRPGSTRIRISRTTVQAMTRRTSCGGILCPTALPKTVPGSRRKTRSATPARSSPRTAGAPDVRQVARDGDAAGEALAVGSVGHGGRPSSASSPRVRETGAQIDRWSPPTITALGSNGQALGTAGAYVDFDQDGPAGVGTFTAPLPVGGLRSWRRPAERRWRACSGRRRRRSPSPLQAWHAREGRQALEARRQVEDDRSRLVRSPRAAGVRRGMAGVSAPSGRARTRVAPRSAGKLSLAGGTKARVRVVVNDGFSDGKDESSRLGAPTARRRSRDDHEPGPRRDLVDDAQALCS